MKIAAICTAPNHNTGMLFVDRSLHLLLDKNNLLNETEFFSFQATARNKSGFEYKAMTNDINLDQFDCIIIWGDFIVSQHWMKLMQPKIPKYTKKFDLIDKILFTDFTIESLKKIIVFGQCISVDQREIFEDSKYIGNFSIVFI